MDPIEVFFNVINLIGAIIGILYIISIYVLYKTFRNNNRLIDVNGDVAVIDIRQPDYDTSIERISEAPNIWRIQPYPSPGFIISPSMFSLLASEDTHIRLPAGDSLIIVIDSRVIDNKGDLRLEYENEPELKPEFIKKINKIKKEKSIRVDDFAKRYGLDV